MATTVVSCRGEVACERVASTSAPFMLISRKVFSRKHEVDIHSQQIREYFNIRSGAHPRGLLGGISDIACSRLHDVFGVRQVNVSGFIVSASFMTC